MALKADQALKLAQKVEKDLNSVEKHLIDEINKGFKELADRIKKLEELHDEQEKRVSEMDKK